MSKADVKKIVEGIGTCSENLIGISENLISISEKVSRVARVVAEIISEFQGEADKPAIETMAKKPAAKQIKAKAELAAEAEAPAAEPVKEYTFIEVRTILADKSRAGHTADVKKILTVHGAAKLSDLDPKEYAAVVAEAEVLE